MMRPHLACWVMPLLALLLAGCAGRGQVSGKVRYKGAALPGGTITFYDARNKPVSGPVGEDGSYSVADVAAGKAKVAITPTMPIYMPGDKPPAGHKAPTLPAKYTDPEKSGLTYDVKAGEQTHDFDLD